MTTTHVAAVPVGDRRQAGTQGRRKLATRGRPGRAGRPTHKPPATVAASVEARFGGRPGWRGPRPRLSCRTSSSSIACGYGISELEAKLAASWEGTESDN